METSHLKRFTGDLQTRHASKQTTATGNELLYKYDQRQSCGTPIRRELRRPGRGTMLRRKHQYAVTPKGGHGNWERLLLQKRPLSSMRRMTVADLSPDPPIVHNHLHVTALPLLSSVSLRRVRVNDGLRSRATSPLVTMYIVHIGSLLLCGNLSLSSPATLLTCFPSTPLSVVPFPCGPPSLKSTTCPAPLLLARFFSAD